jgi:hypothetical protein
MPGTRLGDVNIATSARTSPLSAAQPYKPAGQPYKPAGQAYKPAGQPYKPAAPLDAPPDVPLDAPGPPTRARTWTADERAKHRMYDQRERKDRMTSQVPFDITRV